MTSGFVVNFNRVIARGQDFNGTYVLEECGSINLKTYAAKSATDALMKKMSGLRVMDCCSAHKVLHHYNRFRYDFSDVCIDNCYAHKKHCNNKVVVSTMPFGYAFLG